jgi:hypothetical protein
VSLALAHKRRVIAQGSAAASASAEPAAYSPGAALNSPANAQKHLKLMEVALAGDLDRLHQLNSLDQRQQLKCSELLPKYQEYVTRYRESGLNFPNQVLMYVLVWLFDTGEFVAGQELADFAMSQGQELPERFKRNIPTFVGDAVIDWAEAEHKAGHSPEPYLSDLLPRVETEWKLFERIPARYHRLLGFMAMDRKDWALAVTHLERAEALYPEIRVETRLKGARKALAKQLAQATDPTAETAMQLDAALQSNATQDNAGNGTE